MIVRCMVCGGEATFYRAMVAAPPSAVKRAREAQRDAANRWLGAGCEHHRWHRERSEKRGLESRHNIAADFQMGKGVEREHGLYVLRSDCAGGECCGGTKLWLTVGKTEATDPRFTSDPKLAMRFPDLAAARAERKAYRAYMRSWRQQVGYVFRETPKMKIMRRKGP